MRRPRVLDLLIAVAVGIACQIEFAAVADRATGDLSAQRILLLAVIPALALVRTRPLASALIGGLFMGVQAFLGTAPVALPFLVYLYVLGNLGWRGSTRDGATALSAAGLGLAVQELLGRGSGTGDLVVNAVVLIAAWLGPHMLRRATDRRVAAEVAADRAARRAADVERARIARDLHDSVGHALSLMTLQAGAARQHLHDRGIVERTLHAIESTGRTSISDLHAFLGLLRADGEPEALGVLDIARLLDGVRAAGCPVDAQLPDDPQAPVATQSTIFRVVQESVTNALKHQECRALEVRVVDDPINVSVVSRGPFRVAPGSGSGLPSLRERVHAFGGNFDARATGPDTWLVQASLPSA